MRKKKSSKAKKKSKSKFDISSFNQVADGVFVGSVKVTDVVERRPRFRQMNKLQRRTLSSSIEKFGTKVLPIVRPNGSKYEIVDGHHRYDELVSRGAKEMPVILFVDKDGNPYSPNDTDLAMLSMNVTADPIYQEHLDFVHELVNEKGFSADEVAAFSGEEADTIMELTQSVDFDNILNNEDGDLSFDDATPWDFAANDESTGKPTRGVPYNVPLPNVEETHELLEKCMDLFNVDTNPEAVLSAMRFAVKRKK